MPCDTCGAPDPRGLCGLAWKCPGEPEKQYVRFYEPFRAECGASEVCMHMRVTDRVMWKVLVESPVERGGWGAAVQLLTDDWEPFSAAILTGEGDVYQDADGYYAYPVERHAMLKAS
jgi:hypothetical protein